MKAADRSLDMCLKRDAAVDAKERGWRVREEERNGERLKDGSRERWSESKGKEKKCLFNFTEKEKIKITVKEKIKVFRSRNRYRFMVENLILNTHKRLAYFWTCMYTCKIPKTG